MRIPEHVRNAVVYLQYRKASGDAGFAGTAFLVGMPIRAASRWASYLVTARHVLESINKHGDDATSLVRVNEGEGIQSIEIGLDKWLYHDDERVDVALVPVAMPDTTSIKFVSVDSFASPAVIRSKDIGIGDEVYCVGLFSRHAGTARNISILRSGIITAMPEEPVRTDDYGYMDGYLVELRSVGGVSGSPVFVQLGPTRLEPGAIVLGNNS